MYSLIKGYSIYLASSTANIGKELLETNPNERISWENYFDHDFFKAKK